MLAKTSTDGLDHIIARFGRPAGQEPTVHVEA